MTKERFVEFLEANIFNKYKNHLIILDNAGSHNNEYVKQAIINSGNKYLFTILYTPKTNPIEQYFNQIKHKDASGNAKSEDKHRNLIC